jgi:steroid 5-alpha reductase family enzyme
MRAITTILMTVVLGLAVAALAGAGTPPVGYVSLSLWCALLVFALQWLAFSLAFLRKTETFFDAVGSLTYVLVMLLALAITKPLDARSLLLAACVIVWAGRLGSFLFLRICEDGGDRRFDKLKYRFWPFLQTWTLQGFWVISTACCALAAITSGVSKPLGSLAAMGLALWLLGLGLEVVADVQKRRFRRQRQNRGIFISEGVWAYSQHPNYLGEIILWVGVAVMAFPALQGLQYFTLLSPLFVVLLLTRISGIPLLDAAARKRWGDDPAWRRYRSVTPVLVPWLGRGRCDE